MKWYGIGNGFNTNHWNVRRMSEPGAVRPAPALADPGERTNVKDDTRRIHRLPPGAPLPEGEPRRYLGSNGYVRLRWPGGGYLIECYEHRAVMGNPGPEYDVHHVNGVRDDNRPENLEVLTQAEHYARHVTFDVDEAERLYLSGMSTPRVGAVLGVDSSQVYRQLSARGVRMRGPKEAVPNKANVDEDEVVRLYLSGHGTKTIGGMLGCGASAIQRITRERGIIRKPGRPRG